MMVRLIYNGFFLLLSPLVLLRFFWRSIKLPPYRQRLLERFALSPLPKVAQGGVWVHAASVGESIAVVPLVKRLQAQYPGLPIVFTTTTTTGSATVQRLLGDQVFHVYVPLDISFCIRAFLRQIKPQILLLVETELWPNMLHYCKQNHVPVMLVNGRLSARSARRYARVPGITRMMFQQLSLLAVQSQADVDRLISLGVHPKRISLTGNLKYDLNLPADLPQQGQNFRQTYWGGQRPVWIAASTHAGEETQVLAAFKAVKQQCPRLLLVLVPRHPERFDQVALLCENAGFSLVRRSTKQACDMSTDIFLGDSMGELLLFYAASDMALVGGSLVPQIGGHNPIEPAALKLPILMGVHVDNCPQIAAQLIGADAMIPIPNVAALTHHLMGLLKTPNQAMGQAAHRVITQHKGAMEKHLQLFAKISHQLAQQYFVDGISGLA